MSIKPLRERLSFEFNSHLVVGTDASVFQALKDPDVNCAVWENATPPIVLDYFDRLADSAIDIARTDNLGHAHSQPLVDMMFRFRLHKTLPAGKGKKEAINFLCKLNRAFHTLKSSKYIKNSDADIRFSRYHRHHNTEDFHYDGVDLRLMVALSRFPDTTGGDGSTRILPNDVVVRSQLIDTARTVMAGRLPDSDEFSFNRSHSHLDYHQMVSHSEYVGVGNVVVLRGSRNTLKNSLYHATPEFDLSLNLNQRAGKPVRKRIMYVISRY